jgi:hypothetical protein
MSDLYLPVVSFESFSVQREIFANRETKSPTVERKNSRRSRISDSQYPAKPGTRNFPVFYPNQDPSTRASEVKEQKKIISNNILESKTKASMILHRRFRHGILLTGAIDTRNDKIHRITIMIPILFAVR